MTTARIVENQAVSLISKGAHAELVRLLEDFELEVASEPGTKETPLYSLQLLAYLLQNELEGARFLWKRIPSDIKKTRPELASLWKIGKNMYLRNYPETWKALHGNWSGTVKSLVDLLIETFRTRTFELLSKSYTIISLESTANYLGLSPADTLKYVTTRGWEQDAATNMLKPRVDGPKAPATVGIDSLHSLTEFVVHLEKK
jgi:COP9 signalosome complex subunit 8